MANRSVNEKQHTMQFHVDDPMSSHTDEKVNDEFSMGLNKQCGEDVEAKGTIIWESHLDSWTGK